MLKNTKIVQLNKIFTLKLCINLKNNLNRRELKKINLQEYYIPIQKLFVN